MSNPPAGGTLPPPPSPPSPRGSEGLDRQPGGRTRLAGAVVAKVAQQAAEEVNGVSHASVLGAPNSFLLPSGTGPQDPSSAPPDLRVHLRAGFAYPAPVQATADELRRHVREQVIKLVGQPLSRVDVTVAELVPPGSEDVDRKRVE